MAAPNQCGTCNQSFASDRDLQEHQESAHPENRDSQLPDRGGAQPGERGLEGERVA